MLVNTVAKRIMWGDLDSLGIVFYPRYYEWMDAAGHLFFEALGLNLDRMWRERGLTFGLGETSCRYRAPGRYHQELEIRTSLAALGAKTATLSHQVVDAAGGGLMVEGREVRICLDVTDPERFRAREMPPDVRAKLEEAAAK
jgi:YbgC/YbaW family acyl-CoA thioester hydrolase